MIELDANGNPIVIHYGSKEFSIQKFQKIENNFIKPRGGLWTSPVGSEYGWKEWCEAEKFRKCTEENSFKLKFNKGTKICIIETFDDLERKMIWRKFELPHLPILNYYPDYEKMAEIYDAIWLTTEGQLNTRFTQPNLYGWDCETVLILNAYCCQQI